MANLPRRLQGGLAYIGLLLLLAVIAITAGAAADVWVTTRKRQKEAELLWIGNQFRAAILSYYGASPGEPKTYPHRLEDLLTDNRFMGVRRHMRRIYIDPMTGKADWELLMAPQGGIGGVRSRSTDTPLKQKGFDPRNAMFEDKTSYTDWQFSALPPTAPNAPPGVAPGGQNPVSPPSASSGAR